MDNNNQLDQTLVMLLKWVLAQIEEQLAKNYSNNDDQKSKEERNVMTISLCVVAFQILKQLFEKHGEFKIGQFIDQLHNQLNDTDKMKEESNKLFMNIIEFPDGLEKETLELANSKDFREHASELMNKKFSKYFVDLLVARTVRLAYHVSI